MNILVVGGGREHALVWNIAQARNLADRPGRPAGLKAGHAGPADRQIPSAELFLTFLLSLPRI